MKNVIRAAVALLLVLLLRPAVADGVSAYLPLNLEPEIERQVERVLILADEPILKRPFAVALVQLALPKACERDKVLCAKVRKYLERYSRDYGVTHASATGSISHGGGDGVVPNSHGLPLDSKWDVSFQAYVQPSDYLLASAGAVAYDGRTVPTGSVVSMGFNWAQLDLGYRDHWFSPSTDSPMLMGTEAPTIASATLSNYEPLTRLGFQYELFWGRLSESDHILGEGQGTTLQSRGTPKLFGAQFSVEPFSGWSLGVNRVLQYGGGGLPDSARTLARNFFEPSGKAQTEGNQQASYVSRFILPAKTPFAVYFQYAGENNVNGGSYLLGQPAVTLGIDFPKIWHNFDLTYEVAEWQDGWYVNSIFLDGLINKGLVVGNWGGDQRVFNDGVGARTQMLRLGWSPPFGGYLEERVRTLVNQNYGIAPYRHYLDLTVRYSRPWKDLTVGGEVMAGRDVFGDSFSRISGFVRYGGDGHGRDDSADEEETEDPVEDPFRPEVFVDLGAGADKVRADVQKGYPITTSSLGVSPHLAVGARRAVSDNNDLGVRIEYDHVQGHSLIGIRAIDYRYRFGEHFALGLFAGVERYNLATPADSVDFGLEAQWRNILPQWDLGFDVRHGQNITRRHVLPTDPAGERPDSFYKIEQAVLFISRRF